VVSCPPRLAADAASSHILAPVCRMTFSAGAIMSCRSGVLAATFMLAGAAPIAAQAVNVFTYG